jgi:hypothetical protein
MNRAYYLFFLLLAAACGSPATPENNTGSIARADTPVTVNTPVTLIDSLLQYNSEAALRTQFGQANVKTDTLWGPEASWEMATFLYKDTPDEVAIVWQNDQPQSSIAYLRLSSPMVADKPIEYKGRWKSKTGVLPGITLEQLEAINGKPFKFSGFGWDYGGGSAGWEGGKLEKSGISVQLVESPEVYAFMEQPELARVLGDQIVLSSEPVLKKMKVQVQAVILSPEIK